MAPPDGAPAAPPDDAPAAPPDDAPAAPPDDAPAAPAASQTAPPDAEKQRDAEPPALRSLGWLDRFLALWILLAMATGMLVGNFAPHAADVLQRGRFVGVSVPLAVGLLVMMYPILCNVRYEALHVVARQGGLWKQLALSTLINCILAPLFMVGRRRRKTCIQANRAQLALAWAFLPDEPDLRSGLVLVGLGRCIAMVLVWNGLAGGDAEYCAILVAVNSLLQMALFAPLAVVLVGLVGRRAAARELSYAVVATGVGVFLGIPLGAAVATRLVLRKAAGAAWYDGVFMRWAEPWSLVGLLYTIAVLFAAQGSHVVRQIVAVVRVAAPLIVYFFVVFTATLAAARRLRLGYRLSCTHSFTAASNNFELAIAVAVATFGPDSDEALAASVGPLVEVPVLVALVYLVRWLGRRWRWGE